MTKNGEKSCIIVDDFFPCVNGQPFFSHANGNELWVLILEKAWAKLHGTYERIEAGQAHETLRDLLGAPGFEYMTTDEDIYQKIHDADRKEYIMAAGCSVDSQEEIDRLQEIGLVGGHAYGLIDAEMVVDRNEREIKLLKLRNPWGQFEWKGDWGDKSDCWTPELKQQVNLEDADDGTFWICF